jgi:hypothetical protein
LRHRLGLAFGVLGLAAVALGCGDDEPPSEQTVLWMGLSETNTQQCSSADSFGVPDDATARGIIFGSGEGERLEDGGENIVTCRVSESAAGSYDVSFELSVGVIGVFSATGTATPTEATLDVLLQTRDFSVEQDECTGSVQFVNSGALWVRNLDCPDMRTPSSPSVSCTGSIGFIIENCSD